MWKRMSLVALQYDNNWIFELLPIIDDATSCKTHVIKFVIIHESINFFGLFKGKC